MKLEQQKDGLWHASVTIRDKTILVESDDSDVAWYEMMRAMADDFDAECARLIKEHTNAQCH